MRFTDRRGGYIRVGASVKMLKDFTDICILDLEWI